jgi:hypothetical protein
MPAVVRRGLLALALFLPAPALAQPSSSTPCDEWRDCRARVLEAIERGEFETAHDLAWRAVQTGPRNDADLMYLLARAQALGGRPQDALVMLRRLAERGVALDAASSPDFRRVRELAGWPDVEALIAEVNAGGPRTPAAPSPPSTAAPPSTAPAPPPSTPLVPDPPPAATADAPLAPSAAGPAEKEAATAPAAVATTTSRHVEVEEAMRFSADRFVAGGLAYDGISQRFLFGDSDGRKLRVVGEGLTSAADLVGAASAGFFTIMGLEIDARRGDLWVATAETHSGDAAIHKLQLVSGRLLAIFPAAASLTPVEPVDLAVNQGGVVFAVDAIGGRLLRVRPGGTALEVVMPLKIEGVTSLARGRTDGIVYVAHRDGIVRADAGARSVSALTAPDGVVLGGFERLRAYRDGLVGVQVQADGRRRLVLLALSARGRGITGVTLLEAAIPETGPLHITIAGDDLCLIQRAPEGRPDGAGPVERVVRRIRLP